MKTKYLLWVAGIFCCIGIKAFERDIPLYSRFDLEEDWIKDKRSLTLEPTATIDGSMIQIYAPVTLSGLQASIKDDRGNVVYSSDNTVSSRQYSFDVYGLPKGEYLLELYIGEEVYYGCFSID